MAHLRTAWLLLLAVAAGVPSAFATLPEVRVKFNAETFSEYDDAPNTPDADDTAIYTSRFGTLVIGTVKNAGLAVYSANGTRIQFIPPEFRPRVTADDPFTPAGVRDRAPRPCPGSTSGETFSRYNGVAILRWASMDLAVVTDRGCDTLRFFRIDPLDTKEPLMDVSKRRLPRLFPIRFQTPSPFQAIEEKGTFSNPLDEQSTGYGLATYNLGDRNASVFVSSRHRSTAVQVELRVSATGKVTYTHVRYFLFEMNFVLKDARGKDYLWTPCREEPLDEDPQSEGIVVDAKSQQLYIGFETLGLFRVDLATLSFEDTIVRVGVDALIEGVKHFGRSYVAIPTEDEFECIYGTHVENQTDLPPRTIVVPGSDRHTGKYIEADLEGITLADDNYLIISSQGDSTFHVYRTSPSFDHVGGFRIAGVSDTDGLDVLPRALKPEFPTGLLAVHNGGAKRPRNTPDEIAGFPYDGSTSFSFVNWRRVLHTIGEIQA